jgi:biotin carboxyl carrier protein
MPAKSFACSVKQGDAVEAGRVCCRRSHENAKRNPLAKSGKMEKLLANEGQPVNAGEVLLWVE